MKILVLIPAYNEESALPSLIAKVRAQPIPAPYDILVVNDGSRDGTANAARRAGALCVTLVENLGYGNALRTGYEFARRFGYDTILQLDGDGQHGPESIPGLLDTLIRERCDLVIGSRFHAASDYKMPAARRAGRRLFAWLLQRLGGLEIKDVTSGFQVIGPRAFALYLSDDFPSDYPDANVLLFLKLHGMEIREQPAVFFENAARTSMHRGFLRPVYYVYKMVFSILLIYAKYRGAAKRSSVQ